MVTSSKPVISVVVQAAVRQLNPVLRRASVSILLAVVIPIIQQLCGQHGLNLIIRGNNRVSVRPQPSSNVTVFLYSTQANISDLNKTYWDDVSLTGGGSGGAAAGVAPAVPPTATPPPYVAFLWFHRDNNKMVQSFILSKTAIRWIASLMPMGQPVLNCSS